MWKDLWPPAKGVRRLTPTTTPTPAPALATHTKLDDAIAFLEAGAEWAQLLPVPSVAAAAIISAKIMKLIETGVKAHEQITGQPLDLTKLTDLPKA